MRTISPFKKVSKFYFQAGLPCHGKACLNNLFYQLRHRRNDEHARNSRWINLKSLVVPFGVCNIFALCRSPCEIAGIAFIYLPGVINRRLYQKISCVGITSRTNHVISPFSWRFSGNPARSPSFQGHPGVRFLFLSPGRPAWWRQLSAWYGCLPVLTTGPGACPARWE
jgi:hypothetical protein